MKHLFIILSTIMMFPALANIDAENDSPTCDESVLNASNGTANLEINWEPNVIPLRWYSGNTLLEPENNDDTCTYDGVLNRPTNPTREGYNFAGWRVRPTMEFNLAVFSLPRDSAIERWAKGIILSNGKDYCSWGGGGGGRSSRSCSDSHLIELQQHEWSVLYDNNGKTLYGTAKCSARVGNNYSSTYPIENKSDWFEPSTANLDNATGTKTYCWCRLTGYRATEQSPLYAPSNLLSWIYFGSGSASSCSFDCASWCALRVAIIYVLPDFGNALFTPAD